MVQQLVRAAATHAQLLVHVGAPALVAERPPGPQLVGLEQEQAQLPRRLPDASRQGSGTGLVQRMLRAVPRLDPRRGEALRGTSPGRFGDDHLELALQRAGVEAALL